MMHRNSCLEHLELQVWAHPVGTHGTGRGQLLVEAPSPAECPVFPKVEPSSLLCGFSPFWAALVPPQRCDLFAVVPSFGFIFSQEGFWWGCSCVLQLWSPPWHSSGLCPCPWHSSTARIPKGMLSWSLTLYVRSTRAHCRVPEQNDPLRNPQSLRHQWPKSDWLPASGARLKKAQ